MLADFGADVVKVEQPGTGDPLRTWTTGGEPFWWKVYARNKRLITLNLKAPRGLEIFRQLLPRFDVAVESFTPGTLEGLGLAGTTCTPGIPASFFCAFRRGDKADPEAPGPASARWSRRPADSRR